MGHHALIGLYILFRANRCVRPYFHPNPPLFGGARMHHLIYTQLKPPEKGYGVYYAAFTSVFDHSLGDCAYGL
jgi:hypothetical protein